MWDMKKFKILFLLLLSLILISCSRIDAEPELDSAFDAENKEDPNDKIYTEIQEEIEVKIESDADEEAKNRMN